MKLRGKGRDSRKTRENKRADSTFERSEGLQRPAYIDGNRIEIVRGRIEESLKFGSTMREFNRI